METEVAPTERLREMGFVRCGEWQLHDGKPKCHLLDCADARNVLYAFAISGEVVYVGKTIRPLKQRLYGYQNPGPTQSTNIKGNGLIRDALVAGAVVEIYALPDNGLLYYGGFHVNLAAGLEDSLVSTIRPAWNKAGI